MLDALPDDDRLFGAYLEHDLALCYLDNAATTPTDPRVVRAMFPYWRRVFGNPAAQHPHGRQAAEACTRARAQVAELVNAAPAEIVFTSGATESNNAAIKGAAFGPGATTKRAVISAIEHDSVRAPCEWLRRLGWEVAIVPVDSCGRIELERLGDALTDGAAIVSVMHANNEIGTLQQIPQIAELAHRAGAYMHVDAAQSAGHVPLDVQELGADLVSLSGHKFNGPKGIGALYVRPGVVLEPLLHGGAQEQGRRAGTHNVPAIVGLGKAAELAALERGPEARMLEALRSKLCAGLVKLGATIHGPAVQRLPGIVSAAIPRADAAALASELRKRGVCCSTGSACHARSGQPSAVLEAIDLLPEQAAATLRFSLGRYSKQADVDRVLELLPRAAEICCR